MACIARSSMARPLISAYWRYRVARDSAGNPLAWRDEFARYEQSMKALTNAAAGADKETIEKLAKQGAEAATELDRQIAKWAGVRPVPKCEDGTSPGLSAPAEDEVVLVFHPVDGDEWMGAALTRSEARVERFNLPEKKFASSEELLKLSKLLHDVMGTGSGERTRVRIFAAEPLGSSNLEEVVAGALGPAAAEHIIVSYGADVPRAPPSRDAGPPRRALVVIPDADKTDALVGSVPEALAAGGQPPLVLRGPGATRKAVLDALESDGFDVLFTFGHARASGRDAWASHVVLHDSWLSIADVMALRHVPPLVVLADCETAVTKDSDEDCASGACDAGLGAETNPRSYVQGPTLAHAFLIAGATHVLGSPERIDEADTGSIMTNLFRRQRAILMSDPAAALREARAAFRADRGVGKAPVPHLRVISRW